MDCFYVPSFRAADEHVSAAPCCIAQTDARVEVVAVRERARRYVYYLTTPNPRWLLHRFISPKPRWPASIITAHTHTPRKQTLFNPAQFPLTILQELRAVLGGSENIISHTVLYMHGVARV